MNTTNLRAAGDTLPHVLNAACAASKAASTSAWSDLAAEVKTFPSIGETLSKYNPDAGGTKRPLMKLSYLGLKAGRATRSDDKNRETDFEVKILELTLGNIVGLRCGYEFGFWSCSFNAHHKSAISIEYFAFGYDFKYIFLVTLIHILVESLIFLV